MNLRQRYKSKGSRRIVRFLGFYSIFAFLLLFYSTFARYATVVENNSTIAIAKWQILVNGTDILNGGTLTDIIELVPSTQTTTDNKLAPGQSGYFDIIINPEETEVAIEYSINFDVTNLPEGILLKTYEILEDNMSADIENNQIKGEISLKQMQKLTLEEMKTIRVYWEWSGTSNNIPTEDESYKIQVSITVEQKIS